MGTETARGVGTQVIERLVSQFMKRVTEVADAEDLQESDGWVGQMRLIHPDQRHQVLVYQVHQGEMTKSESRGPFTATITMSTDTFLNLVNAALDNSMACNRCLGAVRPGHQCPACHIPHGDDSYAEVLFERGYAGRHIAYEGERWIVDSERFRKVFRRLGQIGQQRRK